MRQEEGRRVYVVAEGNAIVNKRERERDEVCVQSRSSCARAYYTQSEKGQKSAIYKYNLCNHCQCFNSCPCSMQIGTYLSMYISKIRRERESRTHMSYTTQRLNGSPVSLLSVLRFPAAAKHGVPNILGPFAASFF